METLTPEEIARYSRHLLLREVGLEGQLRLRAARVLVVGAGGLGAPVSMYLAAAGIGTLGLVDFDQVDASNLQRQIIHGTRDVGRPKVESARDRIGDINPHVDVRAIEARLSRENAMEILRDFDLVVDGTDNLATRYLVNDACVLLQKPLVYGSIFRFEGQASLFVTPGGPCYRCLYPKPPASELVPSCGEAGVLGAVAGIVGTIQATEALKVIVGDARTLARRLLLVDAWTMTFREMAIPRDPSCPVCGASPTIRELVDYDEFCRVGRASGPSPTAMTPLELERRLDAGEAVTLVDVREPGEIAIAQIRHPRARIMTIPFGELEVRWREIDTTRPVVLYCKSGLRSARAYDRLRALGFATPLFDLTGGLRAWIEGIDPTLAHY